MLRPASSLLSLTSLISILVLAGCNSAAPADGGDAGSDTGSETAASTGTGETGDTGDTTETGETGDETGEPPGNPLLSDELLNIAHRGGRRLRPEATVPAFETALTVGADVLEFDVHASADGVIVVMHDDTVDRTTDGTGPIKDQSFEQLRMLDAGYWFTTDDGQTYPYRGMGIQIPTPAEVFAATPGQYYMIEIKQAEPSIVSDFIDLLYEAGVEERVVVATFDQITIDEVRATAPELLTSMSAPEMLEFNTSGAEPGYQPPALFMQPPWEVWNQELVDLARSYGVKAHPWTVNSEALMQDMIGYGVDGIITDDPALLDSLLGG